MKKLLTAILTLVTISGYTACPEGFEFSENYDYTKLNEELFDKVLNSKNVYLYSKEAFTVDTHADYGKYEDGDGLKGSTTIFKEGGMRIDAIITNHSTLNRLMENGRYLPLLNFEANHKFTLNDGYNTFWGGKNYYYTMEVETREHQWLRSIEIKNEHSLKNTLFKKDQFFNKYFDVCVYKKSKLSQEIINL